MHALSGGPGHSDPGKRHRLAEKGQHPEWRDGTTNRGQLSQVRFCPSTFGALRKMRLKESPLGQAEMAADEGREPVRDVFAVHSSGPGLFHRNGESDHRHCRSACQGAAAETVDYVTGD